MHDALTIAIPTLAVVFAALLNRSDVQSLRNALHVFRTEVREDSKSFRIEVREEFKAVRAEAREDSRSTREELVALRERVARVEERVGIQTAAS